MSVPYACMHAGARRFRCSLVLNLLLRLHLLQARGYKNEALAALFVMNNVHYIQWSVESSPAALHLLGVAWLERHKDVVEDWGAAYHEATWMPLVHMLRVRGVERPGPRSSSLRRKACGCGRSRWWPNTHTAAASCCSPHHPTLATAAVRLGPPATRPQADPPSDPVRLKQVLKDTYNSFNAAIERWAGLG